MHRLLRELPFGLVIVGFALVLRAEERVGARPLVRVLPKLGFREGGRHRDIGLRSLAYDTGDFLPTPRSVVVEVLAVRPLAENMRNVRPVLRPVRIPPNCTLEDSPGESELLRHQHRVLRAEDRTLREPHADRNLVKGRVKPGHECDHIVPCRERLRYDDLLRG